MTVVLDASALLAYLREEPCAEMVQTSLLADVHVEGMQKELQSLGMRVEPFLPVDSERATRQQGLSLADRGCLSLVRDAAGPGGSAPALRLMAAYPPHPAQISASCNCSTGKSGMALSTWCCSSRCGAPLADHTSTPWSWGICNQPRGAPLA